VRAAIPYDVVKAPPKPKSRERVKAVNVARGGHRFPHLVFEPLRAFTRGLPCILAGAMDRNGVRHVCRGPVVCCHRKARGAAGPDWENTFPGCAGGVHQEQEGHTRDFEYRWRLRLQVVCRKVTALFLREYPELRKERARMAVAGKLQP